MEYRRYRQDIQIRGDTAIETIEAEEVPAGFVLEVIHMAIQEITTGGQTLELGYKTVGDVYKVLQINQSTSIKRLNLVGEAWIEEGEKPYGRVTTATDGDDIHFSCHGKLWPKE